MKKLMMLCLVIITFQCFSQPSKNATKVIVKNTLSAKENYDLTIKTLLLNDYFLESKDPDIFYVKTQPKNVNKWAGMYFLNIRIVDKEIHISGMFNVGLKISIDGNQYEPIIFKGMNTSLYKAAFKFMDDLASKFEGIKEYK